MNPLCKVALIAAGFLWAILFALMIPANTLRFGKEIVRMNFRNAKRNGYWGRYITFVAYDAVKSAGGANFPGMPCLVADMDRHKDGYAEPTYEDLARDPLGEYNWRSSAQIAKVSAFDCVLSSTPYSSYAWCARPMVCYPVDANATTCDCFWYTVDIPAMGKRLPVRNNANKKIVILINYYTHDTNFNTRRMAFDSTGLQVNYGGLNTPGEFWKPSWDLPLPTTVYAKNYCIEWYNLKECFTTLVGEGIDPPSRVKKPVGGIIIAVSMIGLDLIAFWIMFAVGGASAKVGPAK